MSMDVYLEAHAMRDDFSLDRNDESIAWRKNRVPLSWLMFFQPADATPSDSPRLTAETGSALHRYRARLTAYSTALNDFAGDQQGYAMLADYVESRGFPWLSLSTWEVWVCEVETYPTEFQRALAAVDVGPTSDDWAWMLNWCHPASDNRLTPFALWGGANRVHPHRPWLDDG